MLGLKLPGESMREKLRPPQSSSQLWAKGLGQLSCGGDVWAQWMGR